MKIGIFSDLHLHKHRAFCGANGRRRLDDGLMALKYIVRLFVKERCSALVICGDLLHSRRTLDVETLQSIRRCLASLPLNKIPSKFVLVGNHEWYDRSCSITSLKILEEYGFKVIDKPLIEYFPTLSLELYLFPWMPSRLIDAELNKIKESTEHNRVAFMHVIPLASRSATGYKFIDGVDLKKYYRKFDWMFCGDVHKKQIIEPNIIVCGSPMQLDFGDSDQDRGVYIYDSEKRMYTFYSLLGVTPQFILTDNPGEVGDENYYRLMSPVDKVVGDNVQVVVLKKTDKKDRLDVTAATSISKALEAFVAKYGKGQGLDTGKLLRIGLEAVNEVR